MFKILETARDPSIRSNIVIALGDVAVSFSSIVDENSNELYKGLSDQDLVVKKNTLMVLTHLILNGMIKVKGQLGEMAKCLEDEEPRVSDLAKLFFTELSTKDNAIYNNLPDGKRSFFFFSGSVLLMERSVISHLSSGEHAVDEKAFQSTMRYIFSFIEKVSNVPPFISLQTHAMHRKNKPKTSSKSFANVSDCRKTRANGGTLRSASRCSRSSRSAPSRSSSRACNFTGISCTRRSCLGILQRF